MTPSAFLRKTDPHWVWNKKVVQVLFVRHILHSAGLAIVQF